MAAREIEPTDAIEVKTLCALIFGQPGSRKSSLCQTAEDPITLAFDPGIYRAFGRKKAVLFDTWADVLSYNLAPYRTVVVDTIGMCLDKLSLAIIADNAKHGNRLGGLSLQGYGVLKVQFSAWVSSLRDQGKSLVFTAHEKDEKNGEELYYFPDIVGSNYNTIMNVADMVGYLHFDGGKRCLDFNPTDRWMAKTPPCGWGQLVLPDFGKEPDYLARLLAEAKASMGKISAQSAEAAAKVAVWQKFCASGPNLAAFNAALPEIGTLQNGLKKQCWHVARTWAEAQGWVFDAKAKLFTAPKGDADEGDDAHQEDLAGAKEGDAKE